MRVKFDVWIQALGELVSLSRQCAMAFGNFHYHSVIEVICVFEKGVFWWKWWRSKILWWDFIFTCAEYFWNISFEILAAGCPLNEVRCVNSSIGRTCVPKSWMCNGARYSILVLLFIPIPFFLKGIVQMAVTKILATAVRFYVRLFHVFNLFCEKT